MDPIPSPRAAASPNVHIMPAHVHPLPVGKARHLKCHQLGVQGFSFYQLGAAWAKKANNSPKGSNFWPPVLRMLGHDERKSFCSGCGAPYHMYHAHTCAFAPRGQGMTPQMPPVSTAWVFILSDRHSTGKKANNPANGPTFAFKFLKCPYPMDPIRSPSAAAVPERTHNALLGISSSWAGHETSNAINQQCRGFQSITYAQHGQKKPTSPQRVQLVASSSPRARPQLDPISSPVAVASPNVHIMPAHVRSFPVSRPRNLKCHQSAMEVFSFYQLGVVWAKNPITPKAPNSCLRVLPEPVPDGPHFFSKGSGVP